MWEAKNKSQRLKGEKKKHWNRNIKPGARERLGEIQKAKPNLTLATELHLAVSFLQAKEKTESHTIV